MDFLLPDEGTMEIMRQEFESMDIGGRAKAMTGAIAACGADTYGKTGKDDSQNSLRLRKNEVSEDRSTASHEEEKSNADALPSDQTDGEQDAPRAVGRQKAGTYTLLYLYFIKVLGYNSKYGTQIYDAQRSLGGLRPSDRPFRALNGIN